MSQVNIEWLHVKFLLVLYVVLICASLVFVNVFSWLMECTLFLVFIFNVELHINFSLSVSNIFLHLPTTKNKKFMTELELEK